METFIGMASYIPVTSLLFGGTFHCHCHKGAVTSHGSNESLTRRNVKALKHFSTAMTGKTQESDVWKRRARRAASQLTQERG